MYIEEYSYGNQYNHKTRNQRKLLLNKTELNKLSKEVKNTGLTIIPLKVFLSKNGYAKITISLARGKKLFDKRVSIRNRESKIQLQRIKKNN
jgi:SsrA-binding protein